MSMKTWRFLAGKMIHKCWIFQQTTFDWSEGMIKLATSLNQFLLDQCYSEDFSAIFQSSQNSWAETQTSGYNKSVRKCEFMRMMDIYRNRRFQLCCFFFTVRISLARHIGRHTWEVKDLNWIPWTSLSCRGPRWTLKQTMKLGQSNDR